MRRPALAIRHCSWRPGIRLRPSSAWASAHWPDVVFSPGDGPRALLLDDRVEDRFQLVDAELSAIDLAVNDEGRRASHLDLVGRALADRHHGVGLRLILEARHRLIVGEAGRSHGNDQRLERLVDEAHLSCAANSNSTAANALSSPTQRASKKAATSSELRQNSRKMNRTLPVSM